MPASPRYYTKLNGDERMSRRIVPLAFIAPKHRARNEYLTLLLLVLPTAPLSSSALASCIQPYVSFSP